MQNIEKICWKIVFAILLQYDCLPNMGFLVLFDIILKMLWNGKFFYSPSDLYNNLHGDWTLVWTDWTDCKMHSPLFIFVNNVPSIKNKQNVQ